MSYRDDVEALYQRATTLQRELEAARDEITRLRGNREDTSPGMRALRELPDPEEVLSRLVDTTPGTANLEPLPMPDWSEIAASATPVPRGPPESPARTLERCRDQLARLSLFHLRLLARLLDELASPGASDDRGLVVQRLQWLISELEVNESP